jgi:hypothetical protein
VKLLFLFSLIQITSIAQSDTIRIKKIQNYYPSISGFQFGNIPSWKLCSSQGIKTKAESNIMSFDLQYWGKKGLTEQHFTGNRIPDSVCAQIAIYGLNNMIFFTNIRSILPNSGKVLHLSPMNLMPIKEDE